MIPNNAQLILKAAAACSDATWNFLNAICPACESKSLTIQLQEPDTFPDGTTYTEISCGESVTLLFRAGINQWVIL